MPPERVTCPACGRTAAKLTRKSRGEAIPVTINGDGALYACSYDDCHVEVWVVYADRVEVPVLQSVGAPSLEHVLHHFHEALGEAHDLVDKATLHEESEDKARERKEQLWKRGQRFLRVRVPQLRADVDLLEAAIKREVGA